MPEYQQGGPSLGSESTPNENYGKANVVQTEKEFSHDSKNEPELGDKLQITKRIVIRKAELMANQYDGWLLKSMFLFSAFICAFSYGLDSIIRSIYMTYAMNDYQTHSLLSTVSVISLTISAVAQIFFAGLSDVFGRLSMFIVAIMFYVVGTVIQSQAYDVQRYAAGSIFYYIGLVGSMFQVTLMLSDCSSLKWRLLYNFVPAWPALVTVWISGNVVHVANPEKNWSWGIAMWAFIFPATCLPIIGCLLHMRWKLRNNSEWKELQEEKTYFQTHGLVQTLKQLFWKLDVVGVLLFSVSTGCILIPLTIAGGASTHWRSAKVIAPLVLGSLLVPFFIYWESKLALVPLAPFKMLKDRGIWAPLLITFLICFIYMMAAGYLYTILLVAGNESSLSATRITSLYSFVAAVFSPVVGIFVARFSRLKPFAVFGCSLYFVTMALFYHFRGGTDTGKGVIGAMVVWGITSCFFNYPINISMQTVTSHENMATVTAFGLTIFRIGGAVGAAVSGAIWTQSLYPRLLKALGDPTLALEAYNMPLSFMLKHEWGTPARDAMIEAYRYVQKYEVLVGLIFVAPMFLLTFFLRDPPLTEDYGQKLEDDEYVKHDDPITDWIAERFSSFKKHE
ncbi:ARN family MFS transporter [Lachancea thermotolerans CBS 6340]|uniref:KLTH0B10450p n=1 Tax=Lachancea thermotolerans (strain ATCC 56472 / CBS 6340 / NRRL Y-8284) TaxID=559295 RepID=C5DDD7_LACTC|nr:KLTH0B10450p [Lachancea thermotolerans CBS 6340]XP_002552733.1 KLTH0D00110p [Lachancea thermotolerans CBS 6340]CAR21798.1 KLTH0B10450p [Lachancea thermotolerans CBS 6340]CAR22295.1 KLTH0D00110p [Lachancea thermotolerans CBS 6340]